MQKKSVDGSAAAIIGRDAIMAQIQYLLHLCNSMCIDIIHSCNMFNYLCVGMKVNVFFPFFSEVKIEGHREKEESAPAL